MWQDPEREQLTFLATLDVDSIVFHHQAGEVGEFAANRDLFDSVKWLSKEVGDFEGDAPLSALARVAGFTGAMKSIHHIMQKAVAYDPKSEGTQQAAYVVQELKKHFPQFAVHASVLLWAVRHAASVEFPALRDLVDRYSELLAQAQTSVDNNTTLMEQCKKARDEAKRAAERANTAAAFKGATAYRDYFRKSARKHRIEAARWFRWIRRLLVISGVVVSAGIVLQLIGNVRLNLGMLSLSVLDAGQWVQFLVNKGALLFILLLAAGWCARNYRTARHLSTVDTHRANALATFEAFIEAAEHSKDDSIRAQVILETTRAIFGSVPTGYLSSEGDPGTHTAVDIFNTVRK